MSRNATSGCSARNDLKPHSGIVASVAGVSAFTVALRPSWSRSAISPNESPALDHNLVAGRMLNSFQLALNLLDLCVGQALEQLG